MCCVALRHAPDRFGPRNAQAGITRVHPGLGIRTIRLTMDVDELAVLVEQAKRAGQINTDLPTPWVVSFYASTLMAAWWLIASGDVEIDEALIYTKQSFFSGCAKNPGKNRS